MEGKEEGFVDQKSKQQKNETVEIVKEMHIENGGSSELKGMKKEEVKMAIETKDVESSTNVQCKEAEKEKEKEEEEERMLGESKEEATSPLFSMEQSPSLPPNQSKNPDFQSHFLGQTSPSSASILSENPPFPKNLSEIENSPQNELKNSVPPTDLKDDSCDSLPFFLNESVNSSWVASPDSLSVHSNHSQEVSSLDISPLEENHSTPPKSPSQVSQEEMEVLSQLFPASETKNRCVVRHNIVFSESDSPSIASSPTCPKPVATSLQGEKAETKIVSSPKASEKEAEVAESNELQKSLFVASDEEEKSENSSALDELSITAQRVNSFHMKESVEDHHSTGGSSKAGIDEVDDISFDLPMSSEVSFVIPTFSKTSTVSNSISVKPMEATPTSENVMDIEPKSTPEKAETEEKPQESSSPIRHAEISPADLITPPRSSLKRPIQITQDHSVLDQSKIVSVAVPRPPEEFETPKKRKKGEVSTTISPTKVVDESEFTVEDRRAAVQEEEKGENKEDGFPDLSMFSPLGGRKVTYSSHIKRLLKDLEGERNRFRSQFQIQIQGLLTSFEEEQSHTKTVIIFFLFSIMNRSTFPAFSNTINRNMFVNCNEFTCRNDSVAVCSSNTIHSSLRRSPVFTITA